MAVDKHPVRRLRAGLLVWVLAIGALVVPVGQGISTATGSVGTTFSIDNAVDSATAGTRVRIRGTLKDAAGVALANRTVHLQRNIGNGWSDVTTTKTYSTGVASLAPTLTRTTAYRWWFYGDSVHSGSTSGYQHVTAIQPRVVAPMADGTYHISSPYGPRGDSFHRGVDLAAPLGTPIYAAATGRVVAAGEASGFGHWIVLDHWIDGKKVSTVYGHMYASGLLVHEGQTVTSGQHIANVGSDGGSTGPHLHFEVWLGGRWYGTSTEPVQWLLDHGAKSPR